MKLPKFNQKGITHILAPVLFIAIFAAIGGYVLQKSHAAPVATTETEGSSGYLIRTYAYPCDTPSPHLKLESTGKCVKNVQWLLNNLGYSQAITGTYGNGTQINVMKFQSANNLTSTGEVNSATWDKFNSKMWPAINGTYRSSCNGFKINGLSDVPTLSSATKYDVAVYWRNVGSAVWKYNSSDYPHLTGARLYEGSFDEPHTSGSPTASVGTKNVYPTVVDKGEILGVYWDNVRFNKGTFYLASQLSVNKSPTDSTNFGDQCIKKIVVQ